MPIRNVATVIASLNQAAASQVFQGAQAIDRTIHTVDAIYGLNPLSKIRVLLNINFENVLAALYDVIRDYDPDEKLEIVKQALDKYDRENNLNFAAKFLLQTYFDRAANLPLAMKQHTTLLMPQAGLDAKSQQDRAVTILSIIESVPQAKADAASRAARMPENETEAMQQRATAKQDLSKAKVARGAKLVKALTQSWGATKQQEQEFNQNYAAIEQNYAESLNVLSELATETSIAYNQLPPLTQRTLNNNNNPSDAKKLIDIIWAASDSSAKKLDVETIVRYTTEVLEISAKVAAVMEKHAAKQEAKSVAKAAAITGNSKTTASSFGARCASLANKLLELLNKLLESMIKLKSNIVDCISSVGKKVTMKFSAAKSAQEAPPHLDELQRTIKSMPRWE